MQTRLMRPGRMATFLLAGACALMQPPLPVRAQAEPQAVTEGPPKTILRVALFPHIPDPAGDALEALQDSIRTRFERANPSISLQMRRMEPRDAGFYSPDSLLAWLSEGGGQYDVVEIDAVLLDTLARSDLIKPWQVQPSANWIPEALPALRHNDTLYGIPHWLCSDFVITRDSSVFRAATFNDLVNALELGSSGSSPRPVTGFLRGSWVLPMLYLHAWTDTYGPGELEKAMIQGLDPTVVQNMRKLLSDCVIGTMNTCLDPSSSLDATVSVFATGKADALLGYSERLTSIIQSGVAPSALLLSPLPLGPGDGAAGFGNQTLLYVDALVLRSGCNDQCLGAARAFANFLLSDPTYQLFLTSMDVPPNGPPAVPRYLIPATKTAFELPQVASDSLFAQMRRALPGAVAMPNAGLPGRRLKMQADLLRVLTSSAP
jgi:thiamine pyridinylase